MKKIAFFSLCLCIVYTSKAQFTKGQKLIGPSFSLNTDNRYDKNRYSTNTERESKITTIGIGFDYLKFVSEKKARGWRVNYNYIKNKQFQESLSTVPNNYTSENIQNTHQIGLGYITRKFVPIKPKLNFYYDIVFSGNYAFGKNSQTYSPTIAGSSYTTNNSAYGFNAFITPGFTYQIKKNILIDAALNSIGSINYFNFQRKYDGSFSGYEEKGSGFTATSSLSAGALLSNFWFSVKWIIDPKK